MTNVLVAPSPKEPYHDLMIQKKVANATAKEKRVLQFLTATIKEERIKADVRFYDERGLRLAAFIRRAVEQPRHVFARPA